MQILIQQVGAGLGTFISDASPAGAYAADSWTTLEQ